MILDHFDYIKKEPLSGNLRTDIKTLLFINGKCNTYIHVSNVAERNALIAETYNLDYDKCVIAGLLHDISAIIKPADMLKYACENRLDICEAERKYPFLLHQRLSKICAAEYYNIFDEEILSAIECHTTLKKCPSRYEMALFLADKLAWDKGGTPPFYEEVNAALDISLEAACYKYMEYMVDNNMILYPHDNWTEAYEQLKKWAKME
ncbi:MAG: HD domain-containing protein [bacterium]|nr:HD domain-containing protein [bacterium]MCM1374295.1 HD domain-containing protein [Muribaculum sp.]